MISFNQVKEGLLENSPMVTLNGLEKKFGTQHILRNITHTFESGSKTVVLGSNGSGKSTLIKIISGAVEASNNPQNIISTNPLQQMKPANTAVWLRHIWLLIQCSHSQKP